MKKISLAAALFLTTALFAQNYSTAIGIKSGYPGYGSINLKKFIGSGDVAIDALLGANFESTSRYIWGQCLFEKNLDIGNRSGFNWYYGAGPSVGYWVSGSEFYKGKYYSGMWLAIDAVIGIEYTLTAIPLNLAFEAGPSLNIIPYVRPDGMANIALRYAIQ
ncbi:MAG: hypothetical protein K0R65_2871 [Crocinitomicaceae bacterium]|jgi:hypothetical protein|nr:hypothetical protein [Crocinitomicaceae bacterium]